jgi:hypothetical protein
VRYLNPDIAALPVAHYISVKLPSGDTAVITHDDDPGLLKTMRRILAAQEQLRADYAAVEGVFAREGAK